MRTPLTLVAMASFAIAAFVAASPARAEIYMSTSGGGACKAASSGSTAFRYTNLTVENIGTTDQYVVCSFTNFTVGTDQSAEAPYFLKVYLGAGAYPGTATCIAQMASWYSGAAHISSSKSNVASLEANGYTAMYWLPEDLARDHETETLVLNCKLPRGFRIGLIQRVEPEPPSGSGWTP
jgi:hypothetical protein